MLVLKWTPIVIISDHILQVPRKQSNKTKSRKKRKRSQGQESSRSKPRNSSNLAIRHTYQTLTLQMEVQAETEKAHPTKQTDQKDVPKNEAVTESEQSSRVCNQEILSVQLKLSNHLNRLKN